MSNEIVMPIVDRKQFLNLPPEHRRNAIARLSNSDILHVGGCAARGISYKTIVVSLGLSEAEFRLAREADARIDEAIVEGVGKYEILAASTVHDAVKRGDVSAAKFVLERFVRGTWAQKAGQSSGPAAEVVDPEQALIAIGTGVLARFNKDVAMRREWDERQRAEAAGVSGSATP